MVALILINLAGTTLFFRIDLTENKIYSISPASKQVVSTLSEPLTINVFFTENLPAPHNNTERYLRDLLEEYALYANQYFNYRFYQVSSDESEIGQKARENQERAQNYGIYPVQIQVIEKDEVKFRKAYMGLVLIHGDIIERIPTITSSDGLEYQLTTTMQKLNNKISALLRLPEKIQIKLFLSSSLEIVAPFIDLKGLSQLPQNLETIVARLNNNNYGKLEFEYLDPTKDSRVVEIAKNYNLLNLKWPPLPEKKIQAGEGIIGLVLEYGGKTIEIPIITIIRLPLIGTHYELIDTDKMEEVINKNIESLIDINEDLGYLADHGTLRISGDAESDFIRQQEDDVLSTFYSLIAQSYTIKDVRVTEGKIPEGLKCMVISRPTEEFTNYELFLIDQFLMQGKSLCIFLDTFKELMIPEQHNRGPIYASIETGLEKLLSHYGIHVKKSYIMDENCYKQGISSQFGGGERSIYFAPLIKNQFINNQLAFMMNIKGLIAVKVSPLEVDSKRIGEHGITAYKLFESSEKSWEMKDRINLNPLLIRPPQSDDEKKSFPLAYLLEGEFPSYFAGKPIPEKKSADSSPEAVDQKKGDNQQSTADSLNIEHSGEFLSKGKPAKIFLMASSEMLKDNVLDKKGRSPNTMFILNVLDYLNKREDIAIMRSKEQHFNPLYDTKVWSKLIVKYFNIAGLPVLVVIFGLMVWYRRHSRKKLIRKMFQK